jgi:glutaredoxin-related protein
MESIKKNINKIVILVVLIFVATFVFNYMNKEESVDVVEVFADNESVVLSRQIIEALNELEKINIQYDFFNKDLSESPNLVSFLELFDFSKKDLEEKEIGKNNPFLLESLSSNLENDSVEKEE